MWAKCIGFSKKNKTKQQSNQCVHALDFSNQMLMEFPKLSRKDYKITTEINLDNNCFSTIPNELFLIPNLQKISFQENNIESIPSVICKLAMLEDINLSKNELNDICDEIILCENLKKLDLSCNVLQVIKQDITFLKKLEMLNYNDTNLNEIPETIARLKNLIVLEARDNIISTLPLEIGELNSLKRIDLGCNELTDIPSSIGNLKNIEEIYLDSNNLISIPSGIGGCDMLQILDLSSNGISLLPDELGNLSHLNELNVSNNQLVTLPNSIGNLKELRVLRLGDNLLESLPNTISYLDKVEDIYLQNNYLCTLPDEIDGLHSLSILYVDNNRIKMLPDKLCGCHKLKILSLNMNNLGKLPKDIGKLKALSIIDVSNNMLEYLPFSFKQLKLKAFWLSSGQLRPNISLQYTQHPIEGQVITCYLLPQSITRTRNDEMDLNDSNDKDFTSSSDKDLSRNVSVDIPNVNLLQDNINDSETIKQNESDNDKSPDISVNDIDIEEEENIRIGNVFSDMSEAETADSFSSANKYMSISSSHSSRIDEDEPYIDEFMSVSQEMNIPPNFNNNAHFLKHINNIGNIIQMNDKHAVIVQLSINKVDDLVISRDSTDECTFIDKVNKNIPNIHRGDIVTKINSVSVHTLSLDKITTLIHNAVDTKSIIEVTLQKSNFLSEKPIVITANKIPIDFETRVVYVQSLGLTDFGALPIYFEGGNVEQILPFGNTQSPVFISFVDMDLIKASSTIYECDRVIEVDNKPLGDELKDSVSMTQFFLKNRQNITSFTLRNDPPAEYFKRIIIRRNDDHFGFSIQGGYYYNGCIRPNYVSDIKSDCCITNGHQLRVGMWIIEVNGIFVLHRRHTEVANIIANISNVLVMIIFDVEQRSRRLELPGVLSTIPCTLEIINKYDSYEQYPL